MTTSRGSVELATRLVGGVWGHLVGDAVGVPYEFRSAAEIAADGPVRFGASGSHGQPPGTWSDDGALMLALLDSLLAPGGFDVEDQGRRSVAGGVTVPTRPSPGSDRSISGTRRGRRSRPSLVGRRRRPRGVSMSGRAATGR